MLRNQRQYVIAICVSLALPRAASAALRGVVVAPDGTPVARASVQMFEPESVAQRLERWRSGAQRNVVANVMTSESGSFDFDADFSGTRDVNVSAEGFAPASRRAMASSRLTIVMQPGKSVKGKITSSGKAVAGARVIWRGIDGAESASSSDASGTYEAPDPRAWAALVVVLHADFAPAFSTRPMNDDRRSAQFRMPVDFELSRGRTIRGTVRTSDDKPAANAAIAADGWPSGRTHDDGTFAIEHAPSNVRAIDASSDSVAARADARGDQLAIVMKPALRLRGRVVDGRNQPLAGAEVIVDGDEGPRSDLSKGDGSFSLNIDAGERRIDVIAPGYEFASEHLSAKGNVERTLTGARLGSIAGIVIDDEKNPVANSRVSATTPSDRRVERIDLRQLAYSGSDGRFIIDEVPPARVLRVAAIHAGFEPAVSDVIELRAGEQKNGVELHAARDVAVKGRVTDAHGRGVIGATVSARDHEQILPIELVPRPATSAMDGSFTLAMPRGRYDLTVEHRGFASRELREVVVSNPMQPLDIALHDAAALKGVVLQAGVPIAGYTVSGTGKKATTGSDGSFTLDDLEPGDVLVTTRDENGFQRDKRTVRAPSMVTIDVPQGARVTGRVIDAETRQPVPAFTIVAEVSGDGMVRLARKSFATSDGTFDLPGLPAGRLRMVVDAEGYARGEVAISSPIAEGKTVSGIDVPLSAAVTLYGTISDEHGVPVEGARIAVSTRGMNTKSDSGGHYSVGGLQREHIEVRVDADGFRPEIAGLDLLAHETRGDVILHPGANVRGTVVTDGGVPVDGATVAAQVAGVQRTAMTDERGAFDIGGITTAPLSLVTSKPGFGLVRREVTDLDAHILIEIHAAGTISGRISGMPQDAKSPVIVTAVLKTGYATTQAQPNGEFRIDGSPIGDVQITGEVQTAKGSRRTKPMTVHVTAGAESWVELAFEVPRSGSGN
jgi:protocatechuate 3,4-dioxygenase beta subunit